MCNNDSNTFILLKQHFQKNKSCVFWCVFVWNAIKSIRKRNQGLNEQQMVLSVLYICIWLHLSLSTSPSLCHFLLFLAFAGYICLCMHSASLSITAGCVVWWQMQSLPSQIPPQSRLCDRDGVTHNHKHTYTHREKKKKERSTKLHPKRCKHYFFLCVCLLFQHRKDTTAS